MPVYEYWCTRCRKSFEAVLSVADHERRKPECPDCKKSNQVERRLSAFTAITSHKG